MCFVLLIPGSFFSECNFSSLQLLMSRFRETNLFEGSLLLSHDESLLSFKSLTSFLHQFLLNCDLLCWPISALFREAMAMNATLHCWSCSFISQHQRRICGLQGLVFEMESCRLCAYTVCLRGFDSKSHNRLITPNSQPAACAVISSY